MITYDRITSCGDFMNLTEGQSLNTQNGVWQVVSDATKYSNIPRVLVKAPNETEARFIYYDEEKNIVVDDAGNKIAELSDGIMDMRV